MSDEGFRKSDQRGSGAEGSLGPENGETAFVTGTLGPGEVFAGIVISSDGGTEASAGTSIASYDLVRPIGHGGMGEVWLAEQKQPVRRRVALKLIKAGMDTREVVARFESERQALALMDHPAIAKVFDAGSTPQGRPYFVMEYVSGIPITDYCDKHKLTMRQRLELFVRVCDGVQHAHQKAILHRDLKPSNILVGEVDGKPAPRIIDFGVAKATSQQLTADAMFTRVGAIVGTPGYMSPEQADSAGVDVDTRTDVYSLGVVLYELLVAALPLDFHKTPLDEFLRRLREEDTPGPSTRLRGLGKQSSTTAQNRGTDIPTLTRQLRGDLDAITLKALEKDRSRRYATPSELTADIGRYLRIEPVLARPASAGYRARKYVRRHRIAVALVATAALLLLSVAMVQSLELRRITRERDRADRIATFMTGMFKVSDPSEARGNTVTAREILDNAAKDIGTGLSNDPELQARMMYTMADTYLGLGLSSHAQSLLEGALEIQRRVLGPGNEDTLASMGLLARTLGTEGHYATGEKLNRETLDIQRRVLGSENRGTLASMGLLANTLMIQGRYAEAEKLQRETIEIQRRVLGPANPETLFSVSHLSEVLMYENRYAEAEKLARETLEIRRRVLGPDHPDTPKSMSALALILTEEGRYAEAEKLYRGALDIQRRILGPEHPDTLKSMTVLGDSLTREGRIAEAEKLQRETLEIAHRVLGPEHPYTIKAMGNLAWELAQEGRLAEAEKLQRTALDIRRRVLGPEQPNTLVAMSALAGTLTSESRYAEAENLYREALAIQRRRIPSPEDPDTLNFVNMLADTLVAEGRYVEAEKMYRDTLDIRRRVLGPEHPDTLHSLESEALDLSHEGRYGEAEKLFREAIQTAGKVNQPVILAYAWANFADAAAITGRREEALRYLGQAIDHGLAPELIAADDDLKSLHGDPRFTALMAHAKERAATAQKPH